MISSGCGRGTLTSMFHGTSVTKHFGYALHPVCLTPPCSFYVVCICYGGCFFYEATLETPHQIDACFLSLQGLAMTLFVRLRPGIYAGFNTWDRVGCVGCLCKNAFGSPFVTCRDMGGQKKKEKKKLVGRNGVEGVLFVQNCCALSPHLLLSHARTPDFSRL